MIKIARRILQFLFVGAFMATLVILILRGRDPTFANFHRRLPSELALDRQIDDVRIDNMPLDDALRELSRKASVSVTLDPNPKARKYADATVSLYARRIVLADALMQLVHQLSDFYPLNFHPVTDGIRISLWRDASSCPFLEVYDGRDILAHGPRPAAGWTSPRGSNGIAWDAVGEPDVESAITDTGFLTASWDRFGIPCQNVIAVGSGRMIVFGNYSVHRSVRQFMSAVSPHDPGPGDGKHPDVIVGSVLYGQWIRTDDSPAEYALRGMARPAHFMERPLTEVIPEISASNQADFGVDWSTLGESGVGRSAPVTIDAQGMTLAALLDAVLGQLRAPVRYQPAGSTIWVGTMGFNTCTRLYDLRPYFSRHDPSQFDALGESLLQEITNLVRRHSLSSPARISRHHMEFIGSTLVISADWKDQDQIAVLLARLVAPVSAARQ